MKSSKTITIKDIAADTGLSISTISKYLNNKPISQEAKCAITLSISKLNYIPKLSARNLRSNNHKSIIIITPILFNTYWGKLIGDLETELRQYGYSTVISSRAENIKLSDFKIAPTIHQQFAGAFFIPYSINDIDLVSYLISDQKLPLVVFDQLLNEIQVDTITTNNFQAVYEGTDYLIKKGHKNIAIVCGPENSYTSKKRENGYRQALIDNDIPIDTANIIYTDFHSLAGKHAFQDLMKKSHRPTAIFPLNYDTSIGCIMEASTEQILIPDNISLLAFDDNVLFQSSTPQFSVIAQDWETICHEAVLTLLRRIDGDYSDYPLIKEIPTTLVERESCKCI